MKRLNHQTIQHQMPQMTLLLAKLTLQATALATPPVILRVIRPAIKLKLRATLLPTTTLTGEPTDCLRNQRRRKSCLINPDLPNLRITMKTRDLKYSNQKDSSHSSALSERNTFLRKSLLRILKMGLLARVNKRLPK